MTRSLVKWRVDGDLKVIAVEVGRLVQHRQHILNQIKKRKRFISSDRDRKKTVLVRKIRLVSLTGNMSCWLP